MYLNIKTLKLNRLASATSLLLGTTIGQVPLALSQGDSGFTGIEEVVVTAEKRAANVQDIPVAISAFSQDALDNRGITDLESVQSAVPALQFTTQNNFGAGAVVTLRGIGTEIVTSGADQGVALHMDGVYLGQASSGLLSFYDLERLEVLRGPQGTLYGRNATGGSINLITNKPSEEFEAFGDIMLGDYDHYRARGVVSGPLTDKVSGRLTGTWEQRDGYVDNLWPSGDDGNDKDYWSMRGQLRIDLSDNIEALVQLSYADAGGVGGIMETLDEYPAANTVGLVQPPPLAGSPFGVPNFQPTFGDALPNPKDLNEVRRDANESFDQEVMGANITLDWDLENMSLKSISGWFSNDTEVKRDRDSSELDRSTQERKNENKQYSQEFNLASTSDGPWEWLLGAFYYYSKQEDKKAFIFTKPLDDIPNAGGLIFDFASEVETTSWAVFGQTSYSLTEQVRLTLGLRYSEDKKEGETFDRDLYDPTNGLRLPGFPQSGKFDKTWTEPTGKFGVDYFITDESMLYFSLSKGYKSGGLNINYPPEAIFDPEKVDAVEIGSKNRFLDNHLELNMSAFYYDYKDLQLFTVTESNVIIENAAKSEITGVEIEGIMIATEHLALDFYGVYLDAEVKDFFTEDPSVPPALRQLEDLSGNTLPRAPEWEFKIGAEYTWDLVQGDLTLRGQYHWQDDTFFRAQNNPDKKQEAYETVDARLTYMSADGRWRVSAYGKNLGDEEYFTNLVVEAGLSGSPVAVTAGPPRTYGVEVGYRFD